MSLSDEVADLALVGDSNGYQPRQRNPHPAGFEPGIRWDGQTGELNTGPLTSAPKCWDDLLRMWDLDPAEVEVIEPVERRSWDAAVGGGVTRRMNYYKAKVRRRTQGNTADVEALLAEVRRHKPRKPLPRAGDRAYLHVTADLQAGKPDGDGTAGMVRRFLAGLDKGVARYKELRKIGRPVGPIYLPWLGDCIEGVSGHYAMQTFGAELNLTEQVRLIRRLALAQMRAYAPLTDQIIVPVIPGNHDEAVRQGGKAATNFRDSWATDALSAVADLCAESPALKHISFVFPKNDELTITLDIAGTTVALAHGHQFRGKAHAWWAKQAHGMQDPGDATVLLAGHLHHLTVDQDGAKTFIQAPSLDGGSTWWRHMNGSDAPPGVLTLTVGAGGWDDLAVL